MSKSRTKFDKAINRYERKLLNMISEVVSYDIGVETLNKEILKTHPQYKMMIDGDYGKRFSSKIYDLQKLKALYKAKQINLKEFRHQLDIKQTEIDSLNTELKNIKGNDDYQSSYVNQFMNNLIQDIRYKYIDEEGNVGGEDTTILHYLDSVSQEQRLSAVYDNLGSFAKSLLNKDEFINRGLEILEKR